MAREPETIAELRRVLGERLASWRRAAKLTQAQLSAATHCDRSTIAHVEKGRANADDRFWQSADQTCRADGALLAAFREFQAAKLDQESAARARALAEVTWSTHEDELAAVELGRRVSASDVGAETLTRLEQTVDELAIAYPRTPPDELIRRIRQHLSYVRRLLDVRTNLSEHRRLIVLGGWLSLLGATAHVDLDQQPAATARLRTAASLARHADHHEMLAWCYRDAGQCAGLQPGGEGPRGEAGHGRACSTRDGSAAQCTDAGR